MNRCYGIRTTVYRLPFRAVRLPSFSLLLAAFFSSFLPTSSPTRSPRSWPFDFGDWRCLHLICSLLINSFAFQRHYCFFGEFIFGALMFCCRGALSKAQTIVTPDAEPQNATVWKQLTRFRDTQGLRSPLYHLHR